MLVFGFVFGVVLYQLVPVIYLILFADVVQSGIKPYVEMALNSTWRYAD